MARAGGKAATMKEYHHRPLAAVLEAGRPDIGKVAGSPRLAWVWPWIASIKKLVGEPGWLWPS